VEIKPLLFKKGQTNVACYGLGNIRDERLHTTWEKNQVTFVEPDRLDWFNIFVLHQNRAHHSAKSYVDASKIPDKMDLVVWGHEHECLVQLENNAQGFAITQPGSSVVTSLNQGESNKKHVALLEISQSKYRVVPIPLKTVRPYIFNQIVLKDTAEESGLDPKDSKLEEAVTQYLEMKVEEMIQQAKDEYPHFHDGTLGRVDPKKALPLIRLRVDWTGFCTINRQRFGAQYVGKVANPSDILQFMKATTKREKKTVAGDADSDHEGVGFDAFNLSKTDAGYVEIVDMVTLDEDLKVLPQMELRDAVTMYVDKEDNEAIKNFVDKALKDTQDFLRKETKTLQAAEDAGTEVEKMSELISGRRDDANMRSKIRRQTEATEAAEETAMEEDNNAGAGPSYVQDSDEDGDNDDGFAVPSKPAKATKAVKKASAAKASEKSGKSTSAKQSTLNFGKASGSRKRKKDESEEDESEEEEEEEEEEESEDEAPKKKRKAAAAKPTARAKKADPPVAVAQERNKRAGRNQRAQPEVVNLDSDDDDDQSVQGLSVKSYGTATGSKKWGRR